MTYGQTAVIFGGGGFLGKHVAEQLMKAGMRVRIAERNPSNAFSIKPLGKLGQTQFVAADVTRPDTVARALDGADIAVNLVGIFGSGMMAVNGKGAGNVAAAAAAAGCSALVHISAIGADPESRSEYARSKAAGEKAVREAFPGATILRPSIVFGQDDQFTNRFAGMIRMMPIVPVIGAQTKFQPVYVRDVAMAVCAAATAPHEHGGQLYEIGGPDRISMIDLNRWIAEQTGRERGFFEVPDMLGQTIAMAGNFLPGAPITLDQFRMLAKDNVVSTEENGLVALGVEPTPLATVAPDWLIQYRRHGRFGTQAAG